MSEIPGCFKVGDKRGEDSGNKSHEVPKYRNYLQFLKNRELGVFAGVQAEKGFYQFKTSHQKELLSYQLQMPFSYDSCEVNFICGDDISVFGHWRLSDTSKTNYVVGELVNHLSYNPLDVLMRSQKIVDMCPGSGNLVYAREYSPQDLPSYISVLGVRISNYKEYCPPPWYCCCYIPCSNLALFGSDGYIGLINGAGDCLPKIPVPGKVCTLSYHKPSRVLLSGLHTGVLWIGDPRIYSNACSMKISNEAINDSAFLNDQEVIVADVKSNLVKVDLRTRKTSDIFLGHKHSVTKRPFSVLNDMVCATGVDNVIRIWHISGGHPIYVYKSTSGHEVRGWIHNLSNRMCLSCFERDTRTIFII